MKYLTIVLLFFSVVLNAQTDSTTVSEKPKTKLKSEDFFTSVDIQLMDSILVDKKFLSPLYDSLQYVLPDKDIVTSNTSILTTELLKKRLTDLDATTPFRLNFNPALEKVIHSYLKYRKRYYPKLMAKAQYYFPMFEQYLDQYDIPLEVKYLAIVESALKPRAKSRVGATGLWQFMYGTGKEFNLGVSSYVDERQDPVKATIAACKYLSQLYSIFGDWDLALAAYNSGPGNVLKAIKRSGGYKNYWNIRPFLPTETAGYVPAFYATMYIFAYAKEHNIVSDSPQIFNFETDTIQLKRSLTFEQISEKLNVDSELISFLNPQYKLDIIPYVKHKKYAVRLPRKNALNFIDKEAEIYAFADEQDAKREKPLPKYFEIDKRIRYRVRSGDYLGKIANRFGVSVRNIKRWNNLRSNRLRIGQRLSIYPRKLATSSSKKNTSTKKSSKNFEVYTVKKGDSLWTIAKKYPKATVKQIKKWNNIWSVKSLKPGMKLKIFKG